MEKPIKEFKKGDIVRLNSVDGVKFCEYNSRDRAGFWYELKFYENGEVKYLVAHNYTVSPATEEEAMRYTLCI